jgi:glyoxylase-like metal-dependent hydrolase (beta-lactamase superfamily II)
VQVAANVHRLGSALVNFYAVVDRERVTIVDAGVPGYRHQVDDLLQSVGRRLADVEAVVLTHAHVDHVGVAEMLRRAAGVRVFVHSGDEELARTAKAVGKNEGSMLPYLRHGAAWRLLFELGRAGGLKSRPIQDVTTFVDGELLDVPGRPRVVHTPGHTDGHCALVFPEAGVVFAGDAICTLNPLTGDRTPQLMPKAFTRSVSQAIESLGRLAEIDASILLPGHGEPWTQGVRLAAEQARSRGPT